MLRLRKSLVHRVTELSAGALLGASASSRATSKLGQLPELYYCCCRCPRYGCVVVVVAVVSVVVVVVVAMVVVFESAVDGS